MTGIVDRLLTQHERGVLDLPEDHVFVGWRDAAIEIERLNAEIERLRAGGCARDQTTTQFCAEAAALQTENARLREALLEIFDYECQFSSTSLIACTARDALWPSQLHAALAEEEKKP